MIKKFLIISFQVILRSSNCNLQTEMTYLKETLIWNLIVNFKFVDINRIFIYLSIYEFEIVNFWNCGI